MAKKQIEKELEEVVRNPLTNEKVFYKYIEKTDNGITDKRHALYGGMLDVSIDSFCIGVDKSNNKINPLTKDEISYFAHLFGDIDESLFDVRFKNKNNYWNNKRVRLGKEGLVLDLSVPEDFITDRILLTNKGVIAATVKDQYKKATYNYVRMSEGAEKQTSLKSFNNELAAFEALSKIIDDKFKLAYIAFKMSGKPTSITTDIETLKATIGIQLKTKIELFLDIIQDKIFNEKVFVYKAGMLGVLNIKSGEYFFKNKVVAPEGAKANLMNASMFISDPMNGEFKFDIEEAVKNALE
jgi:hypothetical protein